MKVKVVHGAPCSGKSTYVKEHIGKEDIAFDYDLLTGALKHTNEHILDRKVTHPIVMAFEGVMLKQLIEEYDNKPKNVWYTTRYPNEFMKDKLKPFEVEYIKIESTKQECYDRLDNDDRRPEKEEWKKRINEWFKQYGEEERSIRAKQLKALMGKISK